MQHTDKLRYDDVSATANMKGVNTKKIEIEIKGNEEEINWQRDYLQAIAVLTVNKVLVVSRIGVCLVP